jgi:hypothetical protein
MKWSVVLVGLAAVASVAAEEADYLVTGGDLPVAAAANGFVQEVRAVDDGGVAVHIATAQAPIGAIGSYADLRPPRGHAVPSGFELPGSLAGVFEPRRNPWDVATDVLEWAAERVVVDTTDRGPQDASSVLKRGLGRCSGLANATAALLLASGFEARTVSGILIGSDGDVVPHRWIECRLPGAGWVASDPTLGLWAITPRHMVFANTVRNLPEVRIVSMGDDGLARLPIRNGRRMRPNLGADLVCRLRQQIAGSPPLAVLRGSGGEVRRARLDPEARFGGLLPGRWVLEVETTTGVVERRRLILRSGDVRVYTVQAIDERRPKGAAS